MRHQWSRKDIGQFALAKCLFIIPIMLHMLFISFALVTITLLRTPEKHFVSTLPGHVVERRHSIHIIEHPSVTMKSLTEQISVLITGTLSSTIAFHTAYHLHREGHFVIGIDPSNISKPHHEIIGIRANELQQINFQLYDGIDACNTTHWDTLLSTYRFSHILHFQQYETKDYKLDCSHSQLLKEQNKDSESVSCVFPILQHLLRKHSLLLSKTQFISFYEDIPDDLVQQSNQLSSPLKIIHVPLNMMCIYGPLIPKDHFMLKIINQIVNERHVKLTFTELPESLLSPSILGISSSSSSSNIDIAIANLLDIVHVKDVWNCIQSLLFDRRDLKYKESKIVRIGHQKSLKIDELIQQLADILQFPTPNVEKIYKKATKSVKGIARMMHKKEVDLFISMAHVQRLKELCSWFKGFYYPQHIILTTYFTAKRDPQYLIQRPRNNFTMIHNWYQSVNSNLVPPGDFGESGVKAIIFHDELKRKHFVNRYSTSLVKFFKTRVTYRSNNDDRFFLYRHYIKFLMKTIPKDTWYPKLLLFTDLFDVIIHKNPFTFMESIISNANQTLFVGSEPPTYDRGVLNLDWLGGVFHNCDMYPYFNVVNREEMLNAGIIGGNLSTIIQFLREMIRAFTHMVPHNRNCDMAVFNYIVRTYFRNRYVTGQPFHNTFKSFDMSPKYYIKHK